MMDEFQFDVVIYYESELFRQNDEPLFSYPYEARKSILGKSQLQLDQAGHTAFTVSFGLSDVCLEGHFTDQISNVIFDLWDSFSAFFQDKEDDSGSFLQKCDAK